jgi:hypothetical protein
VVALVFLRRLRLRGKKLGLKRLYLGKVSPVGLCGTLWGVWGVVVLV